MFQSDFQSKVVWSHRPAEEVAGAPDLAKSKIFARWCPSSLATITIGFIYITYNTYIYIYIHNILYIYKEYTCINIYIHHMGIVLKPSYSNLVCGFVENFGVA